MMSNNIILIDLLRKPKNKIKEQRNTKLESIKMMKVLHNPAVKPKLKSMMIFHLLI